MCKTSIDIPYPLSTLKRCLEVCRRARNGLQHRSRPCGRPEDMNYTCSTCKAPTNVTYYDASTDSWVCLTCSHLANAVQNAPRQEFRRWTRKTPPAFLPGL